MNIKYLCFLFLSSTLISITSWSLDIGGLGADTDENGNVTGYSDSGFGGFTGGGSFSNEQIGAAADLGGFSSSGIGGGSSSSGGYGGYGGSSPGDGGGLSGAGGNGSLLGQSSSPGAYGRAVDQAEIAVTDRVDFDTRLSPDEKNTIKGQLANDQELTSMIDSFGKFSDIGMATQDQLDGITDHVSGVIDGFLSQFSGANLGNSLDLRSTNIHPNSANIVKKLKRAYYESPLKDPLSRLGLLGLQVIVMKNFDFSFYSSGSDTIYLAKKDIDEYGVAVFYHELLHAGLHKAKKAGAITTYQYNRLSRLNTEQFPSLNGYAGSAQGLYQKEGFGYQEAFVMGWSYFKINSKKSSFQNSNNPYVFSALNYRTAILKNIKLNTLKDGKILKMIHSGKMTPVEVRNKFLKYFTSNDYQVRRVILATQANVKNELPALCEPNTSKVVSQTYCQGDRENIPINPFSTVTKVCGNNYRYRTVTSSCMYRFSGK